MTVMNLDTYARGTQSIGHIFVCRRTGDEKTIRPSSPPFRRRDRS